ncbi:MAG TPA: hypothetical protein VFW04_15665 [Gemmatimonadaceae bacterium]|nr:hypothetical protein [Gemmatimonadaceae bacterium]
MAATMRAKFVIHSVTRVSDTQEDLHFGAVTSKPFDADGISEDNKYSKWTPNASLRMSITNPELMGQFKQFDKFCVDFTPAE